MADRCGPVLGQIGFRISKNFDDRATVLRGEVLEFGVVWIGEHVPEPLPDVVPHFTGESIEGLRVNQVTTGILEQPPLEIQVSQ